MYDIFFLGSVGSAWDSLKLKYPRAQRLEKNTKFDEICKRSFTKSFWLIWDDVVLDTAFDLNGYKTTQWDNKYVHVFKNGDHFDGICLFPKCVSLSQREFDNRFFINDKKQIDIVASHPKPFDIIFISYNEPNADENYNQLCKKFPRAKRVHGVKGIHQAHIEAAKLCETSMLWVVDADAIIVDDFNFVVEHIPHYSNNARRMLTNTVHVWRSCNPINGLEYGYGGVKLLPKKLTIAVDVDSTDMTTSISKLFKAMPQVSNITAFNTDSFSTWRSAFRECVKLSSKIIEGQDDSETKSRLDIWCTVGTDKYAISGAQAGRDYGDKHRTNIDALKKINDFDWLQEQFNASK